MERWMWLIVAATGALLSGQLARDGSWPMTALVLILAGLLSWWLSPWRHGRSTTHQEVMQNPDTHRPVVVYWRPNCPHCTRLRSAIAGRQGVTWVNIWQDPDAAKFVRSVNNGNEVVPTVVIDGAPCTNPTGERVLARLNG